MAEKRLSSTRRPDRPPTLKQQTSMVLRPGEKFAAHFKDKDGASPREYMCLPLSHPMYRQLESSADFSKTTETLNDLLLRANETDYPTSVPSQLFAIKLVDKDMQWNDYEDTGVIEMIHLQTQIICRGFYNLDIQHSAPGPSRSGIVIFHEIIITNKRVY